jgi:2-methylisocitrate lyase-like PEP mutase family enzyme
MDIAALRRRFAALHIEGTFVMPNPWDIGSARILATLGFPALATTSSGHAGSLGRPDMHVTLDELVAHVESLAAAVDVPLNVDAERCFADDERGVGRTLERLADAGASGVSIEDYDPATDSIDPISVASERVAAAARVAHEHGVVLTARAENLLHRAGDLANTIERLRAYRAAGADVVYAPGLAQRDEIARVVAEVGAPVNVLILPSGPSVPELTRLGVRRVSTGGAMAWTAYGALVRAARELSDTGTLSFLDHVMSRNDRKAVFGA